jgi:NADPH:quinone reductase-like Zn-dependent oxidoreductase
MKAVVFRGGEVTWSERPDPEPGPREVLVRVEAAGVNRADLLQKAGHYPPPDGLPEDQPGLECAGVVEATGGQVERFVAGDRVMGLLAGAAQADLALLDERVAMPVPPDCSLVEAGAFPEAFGTAYDALFPQAGLTIGDRVLVTGAAGGVGTAGVQLAVAGGATVIASVRHDDLRDGVALLGATCTAPGEALAQGPFDIVLELVGGPGVPAALNSLASRGRIVVIGLGAGGRVELDLGGVMHRRATVRGSTLRTRSLEDKALLARQLESHVLPLLSAGSLRVVVETTYPFQDVAEAYARFEAGHKLGKIVLTGS